MKFLTFPYLVMRRFLPVLLFALIVMLFVQPSQANEAGRLLLPMTIASNKRSAEVTVPEGYSRVMMMRLDPGRGWRHAMTRNVRAGKSVIALPPTPVQTQWRAVGVFQAKATKRKFPAAFYRGKKSFDGTKAPSQFLLSNMMSASGIKGTEVDGVAKPVEADIWKIDGTTVFFFNQLRGLQVMDLSQPADPRLLASMRIPAVGEDLYLLPSSGAARDLLLLTRRDSSEGAAAARVRVVRFEKGELSILHEMDVTGYVSDSRMVGNQLILATSSWNYIGSGITYNYQSRSILSQWTIPNDAAPIAGPVYELSGSNPIIAAGSDWLAASVTPDLLWNRSHVTVFSLGASGLTRLNAQPIQAAGSIRDSFKMQWKNNVLTTISERIDQVSSWRPVTVLQNFSVVGADVITPQVITDPLLSSLELAAGESLFATRFAGDKAYIVTFLRTDPLWVVDLRDATKPVVSGHIEVPGWSTYLAPIGDLLFSVGWESNTVAASLFDVSDPATPTLLRRINLGKPGASSEATWDEKALKLIPEQGLAMIPLSYYDQTAGATKSQVQLLDVDVQNKDLRLRGAIPHQFDARRSAVIEQAVVSISRRELVTADISDRDQPAILAEVALAWPVDMIVDAGNHLLHIESGQSWGQNGPVVRVSPANDVEAVLAEMDLGEGMVRSAEIRDGKLFVLRDSGGSYGWFRPFYLDGATASQKIYLDVYDATALPTLTLLGSSTVDVDDGYRLSSTGLLWPQAHRPSVLLFRQYIPWYYSQPIVSLPVTTMPITVLPGISLVGSRLSKEGSGSLVIAAREIPYSTGIPQVMAFDVSNPAAIAVSPPVNFGAAGTLLSEVATAGDGLIVVGASDDGQYWYSGTAPRNGMLRSMHVIEVANSGSPIARPPIDLPGDLFAITELDRNGFLAWTRSWDGGKANTLEVSASDGYDAFAVASLPSEGSGAVTASRSSLFVTKDREVKRYELPASGRFEPREAVSLPNNVQYLHVRNDVLIASSWNALSAVNVGQTTPTTWQFPTWSLNVNSIRVAIDGDLLVPFGEYGAERLKR
jgi:Beta propeller domain